MWIWLSCTLPEAEVAPPAREPPLVAAPPPSPSQKVVDIAGERVSVWSAGDVAVIDDTIVPESVAVSGDGRTLVVRDLGPDMGSRLSVLRDGRPRQTATASRGFWADPAFLGRFGDSDLFVTAWADVLRRETRSQWGLYLLVVSNTDARLEPWLTDGDYVSHVAVDPSGTRLATVRGSLEADEGDVIVVRSVVRGDGPLPSLGEGFPVLREPPPRLAVRGLVFHDRGSLAYNWAPTVIGDGLEWHVSTLPAAPDSAPSDLPGAGWVAAFQPAAPSFLAGARGLPGDASGEPVRYDTGAPLLQCDPPHRCTLLAFSPGERVLYASVASSVVPFRYDGILRVGW